MHRQILLPRALHYPQFVRTRTPPLLFPVLKLFCSRVPLREQLDKHRARLGRISLHTSAFGGRHEVELGEPERRRPLATSSTVSAANTSLMTPVTPTGWRVDVSIPPSGIAFEERTRTDAEHGLVKPLRMSQEDSVGESPVMWAKAASVFPFSSAPPAESSSFSAPDDALRSRRGDP